jgi:AraC-like DNA-binding protein
LQFQKRLRLLEARRLLLDEDLDAARAAYRVGYHDASHCNREYKSLFGVPPMRDVHRLRAQDKMSTTSIISVRNDVRFDADQASTAGRR